MAYQQPFYMVSPSRQQPSIPRYYPPPTVQPRPLQQYHPQIPQGYSQPQYYQQPPIPVKQQPVTLPHQPQRVQYQQHPSIGYSSLPYQPGTIYASSPGRPTQIQNPPQQPQYRQSIQQLVIPKNVQQPYPPTYQPPTQQPQPQYSQQKPQYQQQLVQQPIQNKTIQPPSQPRSQQIPQYKPPEQSQPQQQFRPQQISQKDEDLEKKFQNAIDRTRDLVQKYQNPQLTQQQPQQQQQIPNNNEQEQEQQQQYQDLALQYEDGYIYRGQGYEPATREGFGVLTDQNDNEVYSGYWHDNQYHGQGKLINFQAEPFDGPFDYQDLNGIENYWLGYEGDFLEGKMHGIGMLQLTNGENFEGKFNDGIIDGEGTYTTMIGQTIKGEWKEGILINYI